MPHKPLNAAAACAEFLRSELSERLQRCTLLQQEFFWRIYPNGVPDDKLPDAIGLVDRTLVKNENKDLPHGKSNPGAA